MNKKAYDYSDNSTMDLADRRGIRISMNKTSHDTVMTRLSLKLDEIHRKIPVGSRVIYLDIPVYLNVGDLLINRGTEAFLRRSGISVLTRLSVFDLCKIDVGAHTASLKANAVRLIRSLDPAAIIVFQGGGNFGDLYPDLQLLREAVIKEFTERRIVVLPQSVHFESSGAQARAFELMFSHPDIHFFVRDRPSLEMLDAFSTGRSTLMPDMAHALWGQFDARSAASPTKATLFMLRRDGERLQDQEARPHSIDWDDVITPAEKFSWRLVRKALHTGVGPLQPAVMSAWYKLCDRLIHKAADRFRTHQRVETDRLHGMILSTLVSRPVIYHDNSYGKLGRYAGEWLKDSPAVISSSARLG